MMEANNTVSGAPTSIPRSATRRSPHGGRDNQQGGNRSGSSAATGLSFTNADTGIEMNDSGTSQLADAIKQYSHRIRTSPQSAKVAAVAGHSEDGMSQHSESRSSTQQYAQEPWSTFQHKVMSLILQLFPGTEVGAIMLERMTGGSYNRVIGVSIARSTITNSSDSAESSRSADSVETLQQSFSTLLSNTQEKIPSATEQYILRIPRSPESAIDSHLVTLDFVQEYVQYPTPKVIFYDTTENNIIERQYMLQERLPGQTLANLWCTLNPNQKACVMRTIINIRNELHHLTSPIPGILSRDETVSGPFKGFSMERPGLGSVGPISKTSGKAQPQTTLELLLEMCARFRVYGKSIEIGTDDDDYYYCPLMKRCEKAARKLHELGCLPNDDVFHFYHGDLELYNLLGVVRDEDTVEVTGVLDWDFACFVPKFMSLQSPYSMWNSKSWIFDTNNAETICEPLALTVPTKTDDVANKRIFEETVDPEVLKYAYEPEYIFARQLYRALMDGPLNGSHIYNGVARMLKKFGDVHDMAFMAMSDRSSMQSVESTTSTIEYSHEGFDTFKDEIAQLASQLFPETKLEDIHVAHFRNFGGSSYRIVGLVVPDSPPTPYDPRYLVRIPRSPSNRTDLEVAILQLVGAHENIPVPPLISYDLSRNNVLESPYILQKPVAGYNFWGYSKLSQWEKKELVREVTQFIMNLAEVTSHAAGRPSRSKISRPGAIEIEKLEVPGRDREADGFHDQTWHATPQTPLEFLLEQCQRWRNFEAVATGPRYDDIWRGFTSGPSYQDIWGGFERISRGLHEHGFLEENSENAFRLCHGTLTHKNILHQDLEISAVLHWKNAVFAPSFLAYKAPFWMWESSKFRLVKSEADVNLEPEDDEKAELKQAFMECASPEYIKHAFAPESIIARKMFHILKDGLFSENDVIKAVKIIREWEELHPSSHADTA